MSRTTLTCLLLALLALSAIYTVSAAIFPSKGAVMPLNGKAWKNKLKDGVSLSSCQLVQTWNWYGDQANVSTPTCVLRSISFHIHRILRLVKPRPRYSSHLWTNADVSWTSMYLSLLTDRRIHCSMGEYGPATMRGILQRTDQSSITIHQKRNLSAVIAESKPPIPRFTSH
jgi:hypothetical protein